MPTKPKLIVLGTPSLPLKGDTGPHRVFDRLSTIAAICVAWQGMKILRSRPFSSPSCPKLPALSLGRLPSKISLIRVDQRALLPRREVNLVDSITSNRRPCLVAGTCVGRPKAARTRSAGRGLDVLGRGLVARALEGGLGAAGAGGLLGYGREICQSRACFWQSSRVEGVGRQRLTTDAGLAALATAVGRLCNGGHGDVGRWKRW